MCEVFSSVFGVHSLVAAVLKLENVLIYILSNEALFKVGDRAWIR